MCIGSENFGIEINVFEFKILGVFENICNCVDVDFIWVEGLFFVFFFGLVFVLFCV